MTRTKIPTDRQVLRCIYNHHRAEYPGQRIDGGKHDNDPFLAVDMEEVARQLGCSKEMLFGRLANSINPKFERRLDNKSIVVLFAPVAGAKRHAVHFPLLTSVLADYEESRNQFSWAMIVSGVSAMIALLALLAQFIR